MSLSELSAYVIEVLWQDGEFVLSRGTERYERSTVLLVAPLRAQPSTATLDRLERAYALRDAVDSEWAARPLSLVQHQGRPALLLEDPGGTPLATLTGRPWDVRSFLRVAIGLASALGRLHGRGLIHKDVKPPNILTDADRGRVWLTGFGLASRSPNERHAPDPSAAIAGTLAYIAPEQTSFMNRSVDSRGDLYAAGVTFYEMLTGSLPFTATEPIELIHSHVARRPDSPSTRIPEIPEPLAAIVMKLLAKAPEDRYQTAAGVEADLRRCLGAWQAAAAIEPFPLGADDISDQLRVPAKLYGRTHERNALLTCVDEVAAHGAAKFVLVSGAAGSGKSSVVHQLQDTLVPPCGLFAAGKFDQYRRDVPFATVAQALQSLVRWILGQDELDLGRWRDAIRDAVGPNGQLVVNLIPELELVIGKQPAVAELPPQDAQSLLHMVMQRLLAVFAQPEHPLALFLDDLQWVDVATLNLVEHLMTQPDVHHLLLIGAYRDNEVGPSHPFSQRVDAIRTAGGTVQEIKLAPLGLDDVGELLTDTLHCKRERAQPLAGLVQEKTGGNPFFVVQFLSALADEGLLAFDPSAASWVWDLERIRATGYTDNVIDFMVGKLNRLPGPTQEALKLLACLGNITPARTLSLVRESSQEASDVAIWDAVRNGLVLRVDGAFAFLHDRVQEAAYALIPEGERAAVHLRIGRLLAAQLSSETREDAVFDVVNHLNRGTELITSRRERERVAGLNLAAAERAKTATAYTSALTYLTAAGTLLGENRWQQCYALAFAVELRRAECEFLLGDLTVAEERLARLAGRAATLVDAAAVARLRIAVYTTLDRYHQALEVGREYLAHAGITLPLHPTDDEVRQEYERMWTAIGDRPIEALIDLPVMAASEQRAAMGVLVLLLEPSLFTERNQFAVALGTMVNLSLEYGNCDGSCLAYAQLIMVLGPRFGDYRSGLRFGQLGLDLVEQRGLDRYRARVYLVFGHHVIPWFRSHDRGRALIRRAFETAQQAGDLTFAAYSGPVLIANLLAAGTALGNAERELESHLAFARKARFGGVVAALVIQSDFIRALRGAPAGGAAASPTELNADWIEQRAQGDLGLTVWWQWVRRLQVRVHAGDYAGAIDAAAKAQAFPWTGSTFFEAAEYEFYGALAHAACCTVASPDERPRHLDAVRAHHEQIVAAARNCPDNFTDRAALVAAEIARLENRELEAERLYEEAIRLAGEHGFIQIEALANELAARFHAGRGFETIARAYLRNARYCYLRWGADATVQQLEQIHPDIRDTPAPLDPTSITGAPVEQLDLAAVIRASQTVSGEIVLEKLVDTIMIVALEHAGAERGLLILPRNGAEWIEAEATTSGSTVTVQLRGAAATPNDLPESVLRYVTRTKECVILDDAMAHTAFASDPYIVARSSRSVLCLPLLKQGQLMGVLYLENALAAHVFTPARIEMLELLASQAAISLENAHLYAELREAEQIVRRQEQDLQVLFDLVPHHILVVDTDFRLVRANRSGLEYLGVTFEELARLDDWSSYHPDDLDRLRTGLEPLSRGLPSEFEARARRHDGQYRWHLFRYVPLQDEKGKVICWYITGTDIEDRKQAEELLRQQERELRMLVDFVPHHIAVLDATGGFLHANRSGVEYLGYTDEQFAQMKDFRAQIYHPDDQEKVRRAIESLARGIPAEYEGRLRRHDGQYRWHLLRYAPVHDEHGGVIRWYVTGTDIEDRKQAEERVREENLALREEVDKVSMFEEIVGKSRPLRAVLASVSRVAPTDSTVLITGDTGTGKELIARAIHKRSKRASGAFVSVNCAAIPPTLITSELFGHEKGAFTGALQRRIGRFELGDGGTIFLDEIGDLPADAQIALLRVLQEREFERVGGSRPIRVDVRVIAATNRDLSAAIASGQFRSDLFYRLNVFPIEVPLLRERQDDIPLLVAYFVDRFASKAGKSIRTLDRQVMKILQSYHWPGNVRELQNVIERAVILCESDTLTVDTTWLPRETSPAPAALQPLGDELSARERQMIEAALADSKGRVAGPSGAAARLGIPPSTLESKIRALKIPKHRFKST